MKGAYTILVVTLALASCSGHIKRTGIPILKIQTANTQDRLEELSRKNGCTDCHSLDAEVVGPAWRDVATHYKDVTTFEYAYTKYSLEDGLVKKVSLGGTHNWDGKFMKRNDPDSLFQQGVRQKDIRKMIRLILKLQERPPAEPSPNQ